MARGSIRKVREGHWEVRVASGYRRDGSQRRVSRTVATEQEAEAMRVRLLAEMGAAPRWATP